MGGRTVSQYAPHTWLPARPPDFLSRVRQDPNFEVYGQSFSPGLVFVRAARQKADKPFLYKVPL